MGHFPWKLVSVEVPLILAFTDGVLRDRTDPIGYKLSVVEFSDGSPVESANSSIAAIDIVSNLDLSKCPNNCFRPVGLAWDSNGRLFMSSDATGEIYVVVRADGGSANSASSFSEIGRAHV